MINNDKTQPRKDARNLKKLAHRALRALERTCHDLRRRGRDALVERRLYDRLEDGADRKLDARIARAFELLDGYLDAVSTRRALAQTRDPGAKETRAERRARKCERVAGYALQVLGRVQVQLDDGEWAKALSVARKGMGKLEEKLEKLEPRPAVPMLEELPPIADEPPTPPEDEREEDAA